MRYKTLFILLLSLLLLVGCDREPQYIQMPDKLYDYPPVEIDHPIAAPFEPETTVPELDLREIDMPTSKATTFAINARGDVFFAKADGTVWCYTYGDGYACYFSGEYSPRSPIYAFDLTPKRLFLEDFGGVLLDENDSLWGWNIYSPNRRPTKLLENVIDICTTFQEVLAVDDSGCLWSIPRGIGVPQLLMENIRACGCSVWPLALDTNGTLYKLEYEANIQKNTLENIRIEQIMQDVYTVEGSVIYGVDGSLYFLNEDFMPIKYFAGAVQTVNCQNGRVILDGFGNVWLQNGLSAPIQAAENVQKLIEHTEILYLTRDNDLCMIRDGETIVLDSGVLEAYAGYIPLDTTHSIFYTKGDNKLWRKGLVDDAADFDPNMEPELICDDLYTPVSITSPQK